MKKAFLVAGLLFGDEGKGATVDYLTRRHGASLIVKYNGGPQNAHNVVTPDGKHHTFSQFGAGSFLPGVQTYISRHALINPIAIRIEANKLKSLGVWDPMNWLRIDGEAVVITPFQRTVNQLTEFVRGHLAHGSCGIGLGQASKDSIEYPDQVLRARHLCDESETMKRLKFIEDLHTKTVYNMLKALKKDEIDPRILEACDWFDDGNARAFLWNEYSGLPKDVITYGQKDRYFRDNEVVIFEGSQGVMLDETHGFQPHVTWTDTTYGNAFDLLHERIMERMAPLDLVRIGVMRPYATRHGAGPLDHEIQPMAELIPEQHNDTGRFQGAFRYGCLDLALIDRSMKLLGGIDEIALNCMDRLGALPSTAIYKLNGKVHIFRDPGHIDVQAMIVKHIENALETPVTILGYGPSALDRVERLPLLEKMAA